MSEVVFWDILIFLEATRTYVKLTENKIQIGRIISRYDEINFLN